MVCRPFRAQANGARLARPVGGVRGLRCRLNDLFQSISLGLVGLGILGIVAGLLAFARQPNNATAPGLVTSVAWVAIAVQVAHFGEELATGFYLRFPQLLGLTPWPVTFFVSFNVAWIIVWVAAAWFYRSQARWSYFALWFLALGGSANAVAHPTFALLERSYFPGLWTSPFAGVAGFWLLRRLAMSTSPRFLAQ